MAISRAGPSRDVVVVLSSVGAIAVVSALLRLLPRLSSTTVALAFLLIVLGSATLGRLRAAILVSIAATLILNFFFLPPLGTFTIADPENWVALLAFLIVGVIGSKLSAAAQNRAREAIARRNEVTRLFDLTRDVLLTTDTASAVESLARHVARRFELPRVAICLPADRGWRVHQGGPDAVRIEPGTLDAALARARGVLEYDTHQRTYGAHTRAGAEREIMVIPLRHGTKPVGLLAAVQGGLDIGTLDAVAGVVAIAVERADFLHEREAAELVRQKADLAATLLASLSHDLRTPLTAIRVAVENLGGELPPEDRRTQATAAATELDRLTRLVRDILDMARIDAAAITVEPHWVSPADVVDAAAAHVRLALEGHSLRVDADAAHEVQTDPRLASVALSHLLENAASYSPRGHAIDIRATAERDGLHVSVTDRGDGLDPAELEHLFERFYRGQAARQKTVGTGMGLAITRGLLAAAGGRVWAENVPGAGARFSIVVPGIVRTAPVTEITS